MEKSKLGEYHKDRHLLRSNWFRQMDTGIFMQKEYDIFKKWYMEQMLSDTVKESDIKEYEIRKSWADYRILRHTLSEKRLVYHNMKEMPFKQVVPYGCPIFCLANLFNDVTIIEKYLPNYVDRGLNCVDESIILSKISKDNNFDGSYYLLPVMILGADNYFSDTDINYFAAYDDMLIEDPDESSYMVFMVGVAGKLNHRILVIKKLFSDEYLVVDPLRPHVAKMDYATMNLIYDIFCYAVVHKDGLAGKEFVIISNNIIEHLI